MCVWRVCLLFWRFLSGMASSLFPEKKEKKMPTTDGGLVTGFRKSRKRKGPEKKGSKYQPLMGINRAGLSQTWKSPLGGRNSFLADSPSRCPSEVGEFGWSELGRVSHFRQTEAHLDDWKAWVSISVEFHCLSCGKSVFCKRNDAQKSWTEEYSFWAGKKRISGLQRWRTPDGGKLQWIESGFWKVNFIFQRAVSGRRLLPNRFDIIFKRWFVKGTRSK